jgi:hypothetical protein
LQDRDVKFWAELRQTLAAGGRNVFDSLRAALAEHWARSVKEERLSKLILFGESFVEDSADIIPRALSYRTYHQRKGNVLLLPHGEELPKSRGHQSSAASAPAVFSSITTGGRMSFLTLRGRAIVLPIALTWVAACNSPSRFARFVRSV